MVSHSTCSLETSAVPDRHWPVPGDTQNEGKLTSQLFVAPAFGLVVFPWLGSLTGIFLKQASSLSLCSLNAFFSSPVLFLSRTNSVLPNALLTLTQHQALFFFFPLHMLPSAWISIPYESPNSSSFICSLLQESFLASSQVQVPPLAPPHPKS